MTGKKRKPAARRRRARPGAPDPNMREAINAAAIIEALEQHILGNKKMTSTQVSAALALLKKTLPDLADPARRAAGAPPFAAPAHEDALLELE